MTIYSALTRAFLIAHAANNVLSALCTYYGTISNANNGAIPIAHTPDNSLLDFGASYRAISIAPIKGLLYRLNYSL
jgi:hypothetical protein